MNPDRLIQYIAEWCSKSNLFEQVKKLGVAVSGGPDSMALIEIIRKLPETRDIEIFIIHINHQIRLPDSDREEAMVTRYARENSIPLLVKKLDLISYRQQNRGSLEEAARTLRYRCFREIALSHDACIALGHTADDNIETILFNLIRGSGLDGLTGIPPRRDCFIRPLLNSWKTDLVKFLQAHNITWENDLSNTDIGFSRNKIRHRLIPYLESEFNPSLKLHLKQTGDLLSGASETLKTSILENYCNLTIFQRDGIIVFGEAFLKMNPFLKGEMIKKVYHELGFGLKKLSFNKIQNLIQDMLTAKPGSQFSIESQAPFDLKAEKYGRKMIWLKQPVNCPKFSRKLCPDSEVELGGLWGTLNIRLLNRAHCDGIINNNENHCYIKYIPGETLRLSYIKHGDTLSPLGLRKPKKAFRYLLDGRVPSLIRRILPVLKIGDHIAWVCGVGISELFKLGQDEKEVLEVIWEGPLADLQRRIKEWKQKSN